MLNTQLLFKTLELLQTSLPTISSFDYYMTFNDLIGATMNDGGGCGSAAGAFV